nr:hypothetical protein Iba_chr08bCG11500 [Ipomoea batatas]
MTQILNSRPRITKKIQLQLLLHQSRRIRSRRRREGGTPVEIMQGEQVELPDHLLRSPLRHRIIRPICLSRRAQRDGIPTARFLNQSYAIARETVELHETQSMSPTPRASFTDCVLRKVSAFESSSLTNLKPAICSCVLFAFPPCIYSVWEPVVTSMMTQIFNCSPRITKKLQLQLLLHQSRRICFRRRVAGTPVEIMQGEQVELSDHLLGSPLRHGINLPICLSRRGNQKQHKQKRPHSLLG